MIFILTLCSCSRILIFTSTSFNYSNTPYRQRQRYPDLKYLDISTVSLLLLIHLYYSYNWFMSILSFVWLYLLNKTFIKSDNFIYFRKKHCFDLILSDRKRNIISPIHTQVMPSIEAHRPSVSTSPYLASFSSSYKFY